MMTVDQLSEATGLHARLNLLRSRLDTLPPEARPRLFAYEERLRTLGVEPGRTAWPAPPEPTPPVTPAVRLTA